MHTRTLIAALAALSGLACAGPIDPPSGPVASTMKPLDQIEPRTAINAANTPGDDDATPSTFKITKPGSYYLTGNVAGEAGKIGVEITANDVSIDLGGFSLSGVAESGAGVRATVNASGISLRNGTVRGWGTVGVDLGFGSACRVEEVSAIANGNLGIYTGTDSIIRGCAARNNVRAGIACGSGSAVSACTSAYNGQEGIWMGECASVSGCSVRYNEGAGIACNGTASVTNCVSMYNGGGGFTVGYGSTYTGCTARANTGHGFWVNTGATATECAAFENTIDGFNVWGGSVTGCQADLNGRDGVRLESGISSATENTCRGNGTSQAGAGVRASASACRVDSNHVTENDYGIVAVPDCVIVRNTARANSSGNYSFPSGSEYGQILTNPGNGFIATNPWANFAY